MHTTLSSHSLLDSRRIPQIQQNKMKSILCAFGLAAFCLFTLSLTTAVPIDTTTNSVVDDSTTIGPLPAVGYVNGSKLVITSVIKTLEFEVALQEDDNSTEGPFPSTPFIETNIKILNPALLQAVVAAGALNEENTVKNDSSYSESNESDD